VRHRHNLKEGFLEKSKLTQYAYEEGHRVGWDEARILEIESNTPYGMFNQTNQPIHDGNFSYIYLP
jgi:hypothetical protein